MNVHLAFGLLAFLTIARAGEDGQEDIIVDGSAHSKRSAGRKRQMRKAMMRHEPEDENEDEALLEAMGLGSDEAEAGDTWTWKTKNVQSNHATAGGELLSQEAGRVEGTVESGAATDTKGCYNTWGG